MPKLLIVDDDRSLCDMLKLILSAEGYAMDIAYNAASARQFVEQFGYDALILDWELGDTAGPTLLRNLRANGCVIPCLMLTGRADEKSCEYGLVEAGADDYLTKPFSGIELKARLKALMRRKGNYVEDAIVIGSVTLDRRAKSVSKDGKSAALHKLEFDILDLLLRNAGSYFTAENLLARIWDSETDVSIDNVRMHVSNLRKKLRSIDADNQLESTRGLGYAFLAK